MLFKSFQPCEELAPYVQSYQVRHFLLMSAIRPVAKPYVVRPEETIAFYVRGREQTRIISQGKTILRPRATVTGQWSARIDRSSVDDEFLLVQVIFKPGGLFKLTRIPSYELADNHTDLSDIYPVETRSLFNRFDERVDYNEIINCIDAFLKKLLSSSRTEHHPFEMALTCLSGEEPTSISKLAADACLSVRQFERKALSYLGIPCSAYQRISRFAESFKLKTKQPHRSWVEIAIHSGYYDYQHLVRDYQALAFAKPKSLFEADQGSLEKILKLGDGYS